MEMSHSVCTTQVMAMKMMKVMEMRPLKMFVNEKKSSDEIKDKNTQPYTTPLYFMNNSFEKNDGR